MYKIFIYYLQVNFTKATTTIIINLFNINFNFIAIITIIISNILNLNYSKMYSNLTFLTNYYFNYFSV
jgi:hypothetical protein